MSSRLKELQGARTALPEPEKAFNKNVLRWWASVPAYEQAIILELYAGDVLRAYGLTQKFRQHCRQAGGITRPRPRTAPAAKRCRS